MKFETISTDSMPGTSRKADFIEHGIRDTNVIVSLTMDLETELWSWNLLILESNDEVVCGDTKLNE